MSLKYTKKEVIELFKNAKVERVNQARSLGLSMKRAPSSGAFKDVFIINPKEPCDRMIAKFPQRSGFGNVSESNVQHMRNEILALRDIKRQARLAFMRPFIPEVYYEDLRHGVLLEEYCYKSRSVRAGIAAEVLRTAYEAVFPECDSSDIENYNMMEDINGNYKLIDLGLV